MMDAMFAKYAGFQYAAVVPGPLLHLTFASWLRRQSPAGELNLIAEAHMRYVHLRQTALGGIVQRSDTARPRMIVVALGCERDALDQALSIEHEICEKLVFAEQDAARASNASVHGVELKPGTACDRIVFNGYSKTAKACVQAVAFPGLVDAELARAWCSDTGAAKRLFLVCTSELFEVAMLAIPGAQTQLQMKSVLKNSGHDFFGCIVDYFRNEFGEGMSVRKAPLNIKSP